VEDEKERRLQSSILKDSFKIEVVSKTYQAVVVVILMKYSRLDTGLTFCLSNGVVDLDV
jgi:hypothetical protein